MRNMMKGSLGLLLVCVAVLALAGPIYADTVLYNDLTWVSLGVDPGNPQLKATVTQIGADNLYKYEYLVQYSNQAFNMTGFLVANVYSLPFLTAAPNAPGNDHTSSFRNPSAVQVGRNSISWGKVGSGMAGPDTVRFWYYSAYSYKTGVNVTVSDANLGAYSGQTVGIAPEPTSFMGLGIGLCGVAGAFLRKLRSRSR